MMILTKFIPHTLIYEVGVNAVDKRTQALEAHLPL